MLKEDHVVWTSKPIDPLASMDSYVRSSLLKSQEMKNWVTLGTYLVATLSVQ